MPDGGVSADTSQADRQQHNYAKSLCICKSTSRDVVVENRLVKAAMVEGLASIATGEPNASHEKLYRTWAGAGFGMLFSGNVILDPKYSGTPGDLVLPRNLDDATLELWKRLARAMKGVNGSVVAILQFVHCGRQSIRGAGRWPWEPPLGPSAVRLDTSPRGWIPWLAERAVFQTPRAMQQIEIDRIIALFAKSGMLAANAGFDGMELHASHGYLLSAFLSPKTNRRTDKYGGSAQARLRIVLECNDAIRSQAACQRPFVLGIKLNAADYVDGGLTEEEGLFHIAELARHGGLDFIEISGGSYEHVAFLGSDGNNESTAGKARHTKQREAIFAGIASQAKSVAVEAARAAGLNNAPAIICTGGFRNEAMIESAIDNGIDLVGIGRAAAADPDFIARMAGKPQRIACSTAGQRADTEGIACQPYQLQGGGWLSGLVQLKVIGAGVATMWHQLQIKRMSRGEEPNLTASFEQLMVAELLPDWMSLRIIALSVVFVAGLLIRFM